MRVISALWAKMTLIDGPGSNCCDCAEGVLPAIAICPADGGDGDIAASADAPPARPELGLSPGLCDNFGIAENEGAEASFAP